MSSTESAHVYTQDFYQKLYSPGFGTAISASEIAIRPDGSQLVYVGVSVIDLEQSVQHGLYLLDLDEKLSRKLNFDGANYTCPCFCPISGDFAVLSDQARSGVFQPYLFKNGFGNALPLPKTDGSIEKICWSQNGEHIMYLNANLQADTAGRDGATQVQSGGSNQTEDWMPEVHSSTDIKPGRGLWVLALESGTLTEINTNGLNIWQAAWCGDQKIIALASNSPEETAWYTAHIIVIDLVKQSVRKVYQPTLQVSELTANSTGTGIAFVEGLASDRNVLAGNLKYIDLRTGDCSYIDTHEADITSVSWINSSTLLVAGQRAFTSVIAKITTSQSNEFAVRYQEIWESDEESCGFWHPFAVGNADHQVFTVVESFNQPPCICSIESGDLVRLFDFNHAGFEWAQNLIGKVHQRRWTATDGLEIHGWFIEPNSSGPYPMVMEVHGGPVWSNRNTWPGNLAYSMLLLFLSQGYAIFLPNPRGSCYRGQKYTGYVNGDMGGDDTFDILVGIDQLIEDNLVIPNKLGVTGSSYGGFMSSWLICRDTRFAAAIPRCPVTNWASFHFTSNVPHFDQMFLRDDPRNYQGKHITRSPVILAEHVKTPTLILAGKLDRITPPEQAEEFYRALTNNSVKCNLAIYPEEGHGIHGVKAMIDSRARMLNWFLTFMPVK